MATDAGRIRAGQAVVAIDMALSALQRSVGTRQRPSGRGMVEVRIGPRGGVVALLAGLRHVGLHVVGLRGALEILHVAVHADRVRAGQVVIVVDVAIRARSRHVRAGKREASR